MHSTHRREGFKSLSPVPGLQLPVQFASDEGELVAGTYPLFYSVIADFTDFSV